MLNNCFIEAIGTRALYSERKPRRGDLTLWRGGRWVVEIAQKREALRASLSETSLPQKGNYHVFLMYGLWLHTHRGIYQCVCVCYSFLAKKAIMFTPSWFHKVMHICVNTYMCRICTNVCDMKVEGELRRGRKHSKGEEGTSERHSGSRKHPVFPLISRNL